MSSHKVFLLLFFPLMAQAAPAVRITGEIGPEYDSNARRLARNEGPAGSALLRVTGQGVARFKLSSRENLAASYGAGGKLFFSESDANELVQRAGLRWGKIFRGETGLTKRANANLNYYDSFQSRSERDFRHGRGGLQLQLADPNRGWTAGLALQYQGLQFKPDGDFSFHGPLGKLSFRQTFDAAALAARTWQLSFSYTPALRIYSGEAQQISFGELFRTGSARKDVGHLLRGQVDFFGSLLASLWYTAEFNNSNSEGETYIRQVIGLRFTAPLFWQMFLTAKGIMQFSNFPDGLLGQIRDQTLVNIDDENRSSLVLYLARDITSRVALTLRYSAFLAETASTPGGESVPGFLRHTVFFGARFNYTTR